MVSTFDATASVYGAGVASAASQPAILSCRSGLKPGFTAATSGRTPSPQDLGWMPVRRCLRTLRNPTEAYALPKVRQEHSTRYQRWQLREAHLRNHRFRRAPSTTDHRQRLKATVAGARLCQHLAGSVSMRPRPEADFDATGQGQLSAKPGNSRCRPIAAGSGYILIGRIDRQTAPACR